MSRSSKRRSQLRTDFGTDVQTKIFSLPLSFITLGVDTTSGFLPTTYHYLFVPRQAVGVVSGVCNTCRSPEELEEAQLFSKDLGNTEIIRNMTLMDFFLFISDSS